MNRNMVMGGAALVLLLSLATIPYCRKAEVRPELSSVKEGIGTFRSMGYHTTSDSADPNFTPHGFMVTKEKATWEDTLELDPKVVIIDPAKWKGRVWVCIMHDEARLAPYGTFKLWGKLCAIGDTALLEELDQKLRRGK